MKLKRFEQSAFFLQTDDGICVAVDFGQEVPTSVCKNDATIHATFVSHQHPDHMHLPHLIALGAPVYAPPDVLAKLTSVSLEVVAVTAESSISIGDLSVSFFNSDHGPNLSAPIDNLGLVFTSGQTRLLFLGDMAVPSDVPPGTWDAVMIPVGGGKVFSPDEAAHYIHKLGHKGVVIPIHYHGRADRTSGEQFRTQAASFCNVRVLDIGEEVEI